MSKVISSAIEELMENGIPGCRISEELNKAGISCTQATISRYKTGKFKKIPFDIGIEILNLKKRFIENQESA